MNRITSPTSKDGSVIDPFRWANDGLSDLMRGADAYSRNLHQQARAKNEGQIRVLDAVETSLQQIHPELLQDLGDHERRIAKTQHPHSTSWSLTIAAMLIIAAFFFGVKTLEEFRMGWTAWVYCAALVVALPFALDRTLEEFRHPMLRRLLVASMFVASLVTAISFGLLRGQMLAQALKRAPEVILDRIETDSTSTDAAEEVNRTLGLMWAVAALACELGSGVAINDFREARKKFDFAGLRRVQKAVLKVEKQRMAAASRRYELLSEGNRAEAAFRTEFRRGLDEARKEHRGPRNLGAALLACAFSAHLIHAGDKIQIIGVSDLSRTTRSVGYNNKSDFEESLGAISKIITNLQTGSRITVMGITDNSFSKPLILFDARMPTDAGAFSSNLTKARRALSLEWTRRSQTLKPSFHRTDLLGAVRLAGETFSRSDAGRKVLVVLSDARNFTPELDLETPVRLNVAKSLERVEEQRLFPDLKGVDVVFLGIGDKSGKRGTAYAIELNSFWQQLVERSGGKLIMFSPTREVDALRLATTILPDKGDLR